MKKNQGSSEVSNSVKSISGKSKQISM